MPVWQKALKRTVLDGRVVTRESLSMMWTQLRLDATRDVERAIALVIRTKYVVVLHAYAFGRRGERSETRRTSGSSQLASQHEHTNRRSKH